MERKTEERAGGDKEGHLAPNLVLGFSFINMITVKERTEENSSQPHLAHSQVAQIKSALKLRSSVLTL